MKIEEFKEKYAALRDVDQIQVDELCDCEHHIKNGKQIAKGPAKKNILKHGGNQFICRECHMKHENPMNHIGERRQTDEQITVYCPCSEHIGEQSRQIKKSGYYGIMSEPYLQVCGSCSQRGKIISEDQREKIRQSLIGIKRSDEFKEKLSEYMKFNAEGINRAKVNLIPGAGGGWNEGQTTPEEIRKKQSEAMSGRTYSEEHCQNISDGRKKMLAETGGFTKEHREKLSAATKRNYEAGFDPNKYHRRGWHDSLKAGRVFFRSAYEKKAYMVLDSDDSVKTYIPELIRVTFFNPVKKINATYLIDLDIEYMDGSHKFVEVKPEAWMRDKVIIAKCDAATQYAKSINTNFEVWTEINLFGPVYDSRKIRAFTESLDSAERIEKQKSDNREKAKKYYETSIATDKVSVWCEYCQVTHEALKLTHDKNITRNGRYICEREGGFIAGSKPKPKKETELSIQGLKQCNKCDSILPVAEFSKGKATCKKCRAKIYKEKYQENQND